jgi:hypothetical protein
VGIAFVHLSHTLLGGVLTALQQKDAIWSDSILNEEACLILVVREALNHNSG